jgi:hypothetical protein
MRWRSGPTPRWSRRTGGGKGTAREKGLPMTVKSVKCGRWAGLPTSWSCSTRPHSTCSMPRGGKTWGIRLSTRYSTSQHEQRGRSGAATLQCSII